MIRERYGFFFLDLTDDSCSSIYFVSGTEVPNVNLILCSFIYITTVVPYSGHCYIHVSCFFRKLRRHLSSSSVPSEGLPPPHTSPFRRVSSTVHSVKDFVGNCSSERQGSGGSVSVWRFSCVVLLRFRFSVLYRVTQTLGVYQVPLTSYTHEHPFLPLPST